MSNINTTHLLKLKTKTYSVMEYLSDAALLREEDRTDPAEVQNPSWTDCM